MFLGRWSPFLFILCNSQVNKFAGTSKEITVEKQRRGDAISQCYFSACHRLSTVHLFIKITQHIEQTTQLSSTTAVSQMQLVQSSSSSSSLFNYSCVKSFVAFFLWGGGGGGGVKHNEIKTKQKNYFSLLTFANFSISSVPKLTLTSKRSVVVPTNTIFAAVV